MKLGALRPLFLLVLGAHAALLAIPISGASDELVPAPDPEGDTITVTRIPPQEDAAAAKAGSPAPAGHRAAQPQPTVTAAKPAAAPAQPATADRATTQQRRQTTTRRSSGSASGSESANNRGDTSNSSSATPTSENSADAGGLGPLPEEREPATPPPPRTTDSAETSLIAALQTGARQGNAEALTALIASFNTAFTFNNIQTTPSDEVDKTNAWLEQLQQETGNANLTEQALTTSLKIPYPLEETIGFERNEWAYDRDFVGCLSQAPNPATVGLYFDQQGELVDEPVLLRSSGYRFLDTEAQARAERFAGLPEDRSGKAFTVPIEVEYSEDRQMLGGICSPNESVAQTNDGE